MNDGSGLGERKEPLSDAELKWHLDRLERRTKRVARAVSFLIAAVIAIGLRLLLPNFGMSDNSAAYVGVLVGGFAYFYFKDKFDAE